jgi:alpha-tubulin suppressor-like RCC1 family protein
MKKVFLFGMMLLMVILGLAFKKEVNAELLPVVGNPYSYELDLEFYKTASGEAHTIGLGLDGKVYAWGWNQYGQLGDGTIISVNIPKNIDSYLNLNEGETVIDVSAGMNYSSVLTSESRVFTWGRNDNGQLGDGTTTNRTTPTEITNQFSLGVSETITSIILGYHHSAAISSEGRVFLWGYNANGQLGDGTTTNKTTPTEITNQFNLGVDETITSIILGGSHSSAITSEDRLFTWGYNGHGELGDGTVIDKSIPTETTSQFNLSVGETVTSMSFGYYHSSAITSEGRVFTWGYNDQGQLGDGTYVYKSVPTDITANFNLETGEKLIGISLGIHHSGAISSENRVLMWGYNNYYQLGDGTNIIRNLPVDITSRFTLDVEEAINNINLGGYFSKILTSKSRAFSWGNNNVGQLGDGSYTTKSYPVYLKPILFVVKNNYLPVSESIVKRALGESFTILLTSENRVITFGLNQYGQLGIGNTINSLPTDITDNFNLETDELIVDVYTGDYFAYAISSLGRIFAWGKNSFGQLADGTTVHRYLPKDVTASFSAFIQGSIIDFDLGSEFGIMLISDGTILTWGNNNFGQIGDGTVVNKILPVNITDKFVFNVGETLIKVEAGSWHGSAVSSEGRIFTWGRNDYGQLGDLTFTQRTSPTDITSNIGYLPGETISVLKARYMTHAVITSMGRVIMWGCNTTGQIGDGTIVNKNTPTEITANFNLDVGETVERIDLADQASGAYTSSGRVFTWGYNGRGQLGDGTTTQRTLPTNITGNFTFFPGESIQDIVFGSSHGSILTSEERLFIWGNSDYYQLGLSTSDIRIPYELSKLYNHHNHILLTFTPCRQNHLLSEYNLSILLEYDFPDEIESINVNGVEYFEFLFEMGRIDINIPNTWVLDDEVELTVTSITFKNGTIMNLTGNTSTLLILVVDVLAPVITFDYEHELYFEETVNDETYLQATSVDDTGDFYPVIITGTYDLTVAGTYELTYTATDSSGNVSTRTRSVVVIPLMNTEGSTYGDFTFYYLSDENWYSGIDLNNQVIRYNDTNYLTLTDNTAYPFELYDNSLVYEFLIYDMFIVVDKGVYFEDVINPIFDPIDNQYLEAGEYIDFDWTNLITNAYDNSNQFYLSEAFDGVDYNTAGVYVVSVRVTDPSGNFLQRSFDVTVTDTIAPTFDFIPTQYLEVNTVTGFDWTTIITGISDNSDDDLIIIEEFDDVAYELLGSYQVSVSVADANMNITSQNFLVIVQDTTAPTFDFIEDQIIEIGTFIDVDWTFFIKNAADNYSEVLVYAEIDEVNYGTEGVYVATVTVTDSDGNVASQSFNVAVVNTEPPTFNFIYDQTIEVNTFTDIDWTDYMINAADNGGGELIKEEFVDNVLYNQVGQYSVEVRLYDSAMNMTSQVFLVNVVDTQLPVITLIGENTIYVEVNTHYEELGVLVTDNYDLDLEATIIGEVMIETVGLYLLKYNVMDSSGNVAYEVTREVYVQDTANPSYNITDDFIIEAGEYSDFDWQILITDVTDNSNEPTYVYEEVDEVDYNTPGTYLVVVSVTDSYNNQDLCILYITVVDTTKPQFEVISEFSIDEDLYEVYDWLNLVSQVTDNSDLDVYIYIASDTVNYAEPGVYTVTIIAYDSAYNLNAQTIEITVNDITPPTFSAVGEQTIEAGEYTDFDWTDLITNASDNYSKTLIIEEVTDHVYYDFPGEYDVEVEVKDEAGNSSTASFIVTVIDTTPPWFDEIPNQTIEVGTMSDFDWRNLISNVYENSNSFLIYSENFDGVDYNYIGTYSVTVSVSDESGNIRERTFLVEVVDTVKPVVSLNPSIDSILKGSSYTEYGVEVTDYTSTTVYVSGAVDTAKSGIYVITYIVIDEGNNITTLNRIVTVYDGTLDVRFVLGDALTTIKQGESYLDGSCKVLISKSEYECIIKENLVNNQIPGIYTITYKFIYQEIEYTYKRYVFVVSEDEPLIFYIPFKKEEGEEL